MATQRLTPVVNQVSETMEQKVQRLMQENEELRQQRYNQKLSVKVSEKGGVSVYGLGRFPVTLYAEQWVKLLSQRDELLGFIKANESKLSRKD